MKVLENSGVGATGSSKSLLRSHWGLVTGPRALRESSGRLKDHSGRPKDGFNSDPGGPRTTPRALREASRRLQGRSGRPQDGSKSAPGGSRRPRSAPQGLKMAHTGVQASQSGVSSRVSSSALEAAREDSTSSLLGSGAQHHPKWAFRNALKMVHTGVQASQCGVSSRVSSSARGALRALSRLLKKSQHQAYLDLGLNVTQSERSETHSKNLFDSAQLDSASFGSTSSVHVYARVHTSIYIYIYIYIQNILHLIPLCFSLDLWSQQKLLDFKT